MFSLMFLKLQIVFNVFLFIFAKTSLLFFLFVCLFISVFDYWFRIMFHSV